MFQANPIERCTICLRDEITKHSIVEQCLPVKAFGNHESDSVKAVFIGLNPALNEFQFRGGLWKERHLRLPVLEDYGVAHRELLNDTAISDATHRRKTYFIDPKREWHSYFKVLDCFLGRVNAQWSFAIGNVVHTDLIACVTNKRYNDLLCKDRLQKNCLPHFKKTLLELPDKTLLLLNGLTVYNSLKNFQMKFSKEELVNTIGLRGWTGTVAIESREYSFCGWSSPVGKLSKLRRIDLAHWVKQQI